MNSAIQKGMYRALLAGLLVGCQQPLSREIEFYIDPAFSSFQAGQIVYGLKEWSDSTEGFVTFTQTEDWEYDSNRIIFAPSSMADLSRRADSPKIVSGMTHVSYSGDERICWLAVENTRGFDWVVRHEAGHAMGLEHDDPGTVMNINWGDASQHVTCRDVVNLCDELGCAGRAMKICQ
jgi:hypothetical protein